MALPVAHVLIADIVVDLSTVWDVHDVSRAAATLACMGNDLLSRIADEMWRRVDAIATSEMFPMGYCMERGCIPKVIPAESMRSVLVSCGSPVSGSVDDLRRRIGYDAVVGNRCPIRRKSAVYVATLARVNICRSSAKTLYGIDIPMPHRRFPFSRVREMARKCLPAPSEPSAERRFEWLVEIKPRMMRQEDIRRHIDEAGLPMPSLWDLRCDAYVIRAEGTVEEAVERLTAQERRRKRARELNDIIIGEFPEATPSLDGDLYVSGSGTLQDSVARHRIQESARQRRRSQLRSLLESRGLQNLSNGSLLCRRWIQNGGNMPRVSDIMAETGWFFPKTVSAPRYFEMDA